MQRFPEFVRSDDHIDHKNALEFDNRPFNNLTDQLHAMVKRHNSIVPEWGITYFLGDVGFRADNVRSYLSHLNGTKILVLGNHDKGRHAMLKAGFDAVVNNLSIYIGKELVTMSHAPLLGTFREDTSTFKRKANSKHWHGSEDERMLPFTVPNFGQFHLHGHIHSNPNNKQQSKKILGRQFDVGVVANNYMPVSFSEIESWIQRTKQEERRRLRTEGYVDL